MPAPTTSEELIDLVRKSELVAAPRIDEFVAARRVKASPPRELAGQMVASGLLTNFQAEQFLQGKWRGFTIGKYKVLERIGSGGMGTVYLCEHLMVLRKVAVKVLPTSQATNPSALGRFYREARAAGSIDHPNLVKAHDIDQENGVHFLVMDYVDGASLQDMVSRFGPMEPRRAGAYIAQAARGLQAAHEAGLVHRDIKPGNILVERNGTVRVLDLGLARFAEDNTDLLTLQYDEKNVLGTADYVAPEQALNSHEVDIRADIYSLGCTFYFCLTGQPLFPTGKVAQKLIWHQCRQPTPVRELRAEVPEAMAAVLERMLAKEPDERYQMPHEVAEALSRWAEDYEEAPREEEMPKLSAAVTAPTTQAGPSPTTPRPSGPVHTAVRPRSAPIPRPMPRRETETPRALAMPSKETAIEQPRPNSAPTRLLEKAKRQSAPPPPKSGATVFVAVLVVLLSCAAGVALSWWTGMK